MKDNLTLTKTFQKQDIERKLTLINDIKLLN